MAVSVVVASFNRAPLLAQCVGALKRESDTGELEIVVVRDWATHPDGRELVQRWPDVTWVDASPDATVPELRATGARATTHPIVAFLEDDCIATTGWLAAIEAAHTGQAAVVGGAVEPGPYRRGVDWAVYLCEFAPYMQPLRTGPAVAVAGNNVSYKRGPLFAVLRAVDDLTDDVVHSAMRAAGERFEADGSIEVRNVNSWSGSHAAVAPFHHGRAYAGRRVSGRRWPARLRFAVQSFALPAVRMGRVASALRRKRRRLVLRALPWVLVFEFSWSAGELAGSLFGPGRSQARWR